MEYLSRDQVIESLKTGNKNFKQCDLSGLNLSGLNLSGLFLRGADLTGANFTDADLKCADLTGAKLTAVELRECVGDGKRIKNIDGLLWKIAYTKDFLQIGCRGHLIDEWRGFDDNTISQMALSALDFWMTNKTNIFNRIKNNPAE